MGQKASNLVVTLESPPREHHSPLAGLGEGDFIYGYLSSSLQSGLNSCYDNMVNRIQVTTEGFNGIVLFGEKNGCLNASLTQIWKGKAAFL